jgi:DNA-binding NarL/FixJ family response regulator
MQKKTVFLLQDTKEANDELKTQFTSDGEYEVVGTSTDGISAITAVADKKPDLLITGLVVKGYDGLCVIRKLKEINVKTKIIVLSALCSEEIVSRAMNSGANYFLAKPYSFAVLKQRCTEVLSEKEINIIIDLKVGKENATAWGCDLTYDYVKINGDYRT